MNSLFRSVAVTIARSIALGTKLSGGVVRESIQLLRLAHCGSKVIRYPRILAQVAQSLRPTLRKLFCRLAEPEQMKR